MPRCFLRLVLILLLPLGTQAAEKSADLAVTLSAANLVSLTSCFEPERNLSIRVAVFNRGFEHVSSKVYLQWIDWSEAGPRLLKSTLVSELSSGMWSVDQPAVVAGERCAMQIDASHTYSSEPARFLLRPVGLGKYSILSSSASKHGK